MQESLALEERLAAYRTAQEAAGEEKAAVAAGPGLAVAAAPGLANAAGEYNCFLNVIVQCLWHCGEFREEVRSLKENVRRVVVAAKGVLPRALPCPSQTGCGFS